MEENYVGPAAQFVRVLGLGALEPREICSSSKHKIIASNLFVGFFLRPLSHGGERRGLFRFFCRGDRGFSKIIEIIGRVLAGRL